MLCYAPTFYSKKLDDATGSYVYRTRTRICTRADRELEESLKRDPLSRAAYAFAYYIVISLPAWGGARNVYFSPVRRGEKNRGEDRISAERSSPRRYFNPLSVANRQERIGRDFIIVAWV